MDLIVKIQHVIGLLVVIGGLIWGLFKFYLKSYRSEIKADTDILLSNIQKENLQSIEKIKKEIKDDRTENEQSIEKIKKEIKEERKEDYKELLNKLNSSCSSEICDVRIKNKVESQFQLLNRDIVEIAKFMGELKMILSNQQETLLSIQLSLTEIKPRVDSLERRLDKLENRVDHAEK
jgi:uncharacterized membrane protein YgaE (UPF0421/DUF939 family)